MIKTHEESYIGLRTLTQIRNSCDIILQAEKTESIDSDSKQQLYLCEIISRFNYQKSGTVESLLGEIVKLNNENRRLNRKIEKLEIALKR